MKSLWNISEVDTYWLRTVVLQGNLALSNLPLRYEASVRLYGNGMRLDEL